MKILQANPHASYRANPSVIDNAVSRVLNSGWYILGREVEHFEQDFAAFIGCRYGIGVGNGTDSLELILRALNIGSGDLVATVANTAVATVSAIERTGAQVRFCDISTDSFTMSPDSLAQLLEKEPKIKAVIAVHLFGQSCELDAIAELTGKYQIPLIEDCAQAHGAQYKGKKCGSYGIAGSFSFYPTKNLGAFGDGGAVTTNDETLYRKIQALRQYGWTRRYISEFSGVNSRLDEIQAAILSAKLPFLAKNNEKRREIAEKYRDGLKNIPEILLPAERAGAYHVYHQFVVRIHEKREELIAFLQEQEIGTAIHYPCPVHLQNAYCHIPRTVSLKNTEQVNSEILSLPMYPELSDSEIKTIIDAIQRFFR